MDQTDAHAAIQAAGFFEARRTAKVIEYSSDRASRVIYLRLGQGFPERADVVINPEVPTSALLSIPGITLDPSRELRFGSNMKAFPKATNEGKAPEHYGRLFRSHSCEALTAFCRAYAQIP
jgi:hypothetical protein